MNEKWNLDILYKGVDSNFKTDFEKLKNMPAMLEKAIKDNENKGDLERAEGFLGALEEENRLIYKLYLFVSLSLATDSTNGEMLGYQNTIMSVLAACAGYETVIFKSLSKIEDIDGLAKKSEIIKEYEFYLKEIKAKCEHMLSDTEEELISAMNVYAGQGWSGFRDFVTSTVKVDYDGKVVSLPEIRNLAYDKDKKVRKAAYEAEIKSYEKFKDSVCFALNNIKKQVIMLGKKRGYESPLDEALFKSRMSRETLDAMMNTIYEYIPRLREFYKAKAKYLGYKNGLPWYELFAPTGKDDRSFTTEQCRDYLLTCFENLTPDMSAFMKEAFDNSWIDFFPRSGKQGGAFDCELTGFGESRILTNFDGSFSSVDTLAHELGHGFHDRQIKNHRILNHEYTMPIAETASTFNETFLGAYALKSATKEEKISLLDGALSEKLQCIIDITSRFIFESDVFEKCGDKFLMPDDLNEMMIEAQKKTYGDSIDPEYMHPFMWANKSHYYSEGLSFYNFPYAFGLLFSQGLYALYLKDEKNFAKKYEEMLHNTVTCSIEDCGKFMGVDLTKPDFWRESLETLAKDVEEYCKLIG